MHLVGFIIRSEFRYSEKEYSCKTHTQTYTHTHTHISVNHKLCTVLCVSIYRSAGKMTKIDIMKQHRQENQYHVASVIKRNILFTACKPLNNL